MKTLEGSTLSEVSGGDDVGAVASAAAGAVIGAKFGVAGGPETVIAGAIVGAAAGLVVYEVAEML